MSMRSICGVAIALFACVAAVGCVSYGYHQTVSMGQVEPPMEPVAGSDQPFYDELSPYGRWVYVSGPGWVWSPSHVLAGWRPYQLGHWVYTDYGWTWSSDEEWGWAVYHYGRWNLDASYGWVWVPGTEWGPAWVAWHEGGGYVGWAPLPWNVHVEAGVDFNWGSVNVSIAPSWWCFVGTRHLVDPGWRTHVVPASRNVSIIRVTHNVTNYTYIDNRVINGGVRVETVGRAVGHTIPRYHVTETDAPDTTRGGRLRGQDFVLYRHDPPRGRNSRGHVDPPGHDPSHHGREQRLETENVQEPPSPPAVEPPPPQNRQDQPDRSRYSQPNRGHQYRDPWRGNQPPPRAPRGTDPQPPSNAPSQPAGDNPPAAGNPPAAQNPQGPGRSEHHVDTAPPARPDQPKAQDAKEKGKAARDAASNGRKPKPNGPKPNESKPEEPKEEKPDSNQ